jgi:uncharacterized protein with HEPN domain
MLSDAATAALRDIMHHIDLVSSFVAGFDTQSFRDDLRTVYAVTRCLEIISEASRRLPDDLKTIKPMPDIRGSAVAQFGVEGVAQRVTE